jgi:sporulation related protein
MDKYPRSSVLPHRDPRQHPRPRGQPCLPKRQPLRPGTFDSQQLTENYAARVRWAGELVDAGQPFWTTVVASVTSGPDAEAVAARLRTNGQTGDVLDSSQYGSLNPGYWVAFSGRFATRSEADDHTAELKVAGFAGVYTREVSH